jgi:Predicted solute binding protein
MHKFFLTAVFLALLLSSLQVSSAQEPYQQFLPIVRKEGTSEATTPTVEPTTPTVEPTTPTSEPTTPTVEPTTPTSEPTTPTVEPTTPTVEPTTPTSEPTTPTVEPTTPTVEPTTPTVEPTTPTSEPTTPTVEPTTPTPSPAIQYIPNGGFEEGAAGWTINGASIINSPTDAHSGSYFVRFGNPGTTRQSISIIVTVPSEAPYLTFWSKAESVLSDCFVDAGYIWVDDDLSDSNPGEIIYPKFDFCSSGQHDYRLEVVDFSKYAGKTVQIEFALSTSATFQSSWSVDDIDFRDASILE